MEAPTCPYCLEAINPGAKKCKNCGEYLLPKQASRSTFLDFYRITLDAIAKLSIPAAILIGALVFKTEIQNAIPRAEEVEIFGAKIRFAKASVYASFVKDELNKIESNPTSTTAKEAILNIRKASTGLLDLHPLSLYYLIGAADGGVLHYEYVYLPNKKYIDALATSKLATLQEVPGSVDSSDPFKGKKGLRIVLSDRGKEVLHAIDVPTKEPVVAK